MRAIRFIVNVAWLCQVLIPSSTGNIVDTTSFIATYMKSKPQPHIRSSDFMYMLSNGLSKFYDKDYDGAIDLFNMLLQAYPNHFEGFYNLGVVYQQAGDAAKAIFYYSAALNSNPLDRRARLNLATIYHLRSDIFVAIDEYKYVLCHILMSLIPYHSKILAYLSDEPWDIDYTGKVRSNLGAAYLQTGQIKKVLNQNNEYVCI